IVNLTALSQADPQYTNYMFHKLGFNPATAGINDAINGFAVNRFQWEGMKGAPKTLSLSVDAPINLFGASGGLGLNISSDQLGFANNTVFNVNYAFRTELNIGTLSLGASVGAYHQSVNGNWEV